ncbi:MAG: isocitrate/isopropylmalate family dehydrogenase, partial [Nisaea sp.]
MKKYQIAAVPGDGIGPEVVDAGVEILESLASSSEEFELSFEHFPWGGDYYRKHGVMMPENGVDTLRRFDAILFGSA